MHIKLSGDDFPGRLNLMASRNLVKVGVAAYEGGDHLTAVMMLSQGVRSDIGNWQARLCLAISCYKTGMVNVAIKHFEQVLKHCPDEDLKAQAEAALALARCGRFSPALLNSSVASPDRLIHVIS